MALGKTVSSLPPPLTALPSPFSPVGNLFSTRKYHCRLVALVVGEHLVI